MAGQAPPRVAARAPEVTERAAARPAVALDSMGAQPGALTGRSGGRLVREGDVMSEPTTIRWADLERQLASDVYECPEPDCICLVFMQRNQRGNLNMNSDCEHVHEVEINAELRGAYIERQRTRQWLERHGHD